MCSKLVSLLFLLMCKEKSPINNKSKNTYAIKSEPLLGTKEIEKYQFHESEQRKWSIENVMYVGMLICGEGQVLYDIRARLLFRD